MRLHRWPKVGFCWVTRRPEFLEHHVELVAARSDRPDHHAAARGDDASAYGFRPLASVLGCESAGLGGDDIATAQHSSLKRRSGGETAAQTDEVPCQFVYADD